MISPSEIRLGNLLTFHDDPKIRPATLATFRYLEKHGENCGFKPVSITSELLDAMGVYTANKNKMSHKIRIRNRQETVYVTRNNDTWDIQLNHGQVLVSVKYIHQFQNIFFSLTGTDLSLPVFF